METTGALSKPTSICSTPKNSGTSVLFSEKQAMSTSLRERLKKARRSFSSTFTVAKRLKIDGENERSTYEDGTSSKDLCLLPQDKDECLETISAKTLGLKSAARERGCPLSESSGCSKTTQNSAEFNLLGADCGQLGLLEEKMNLVKQIQEKEELLRRLKLVKMYRSKNNPTELGSLISKWRRSSQAVLYELQSASSTDSRKLSITQLIDTFGLNDQLLHYNRTEEDFTDA